MPEIPNPYDLLEKRVAAARTASYRPVAAKIVAGWLADDTSPYGITAYEQAVRRLSLEVNGQITDPYRTKNFGAQPPGGLAHARREAARIEQEAVVDLVAEQLRLEAIRACYADPLIQAHEAAWVEYCRGVGVVAWSKGDKEQAFIAQWRSLLDARRDAEEYEDATAVRAIDARLERLVGIPHPAAATNPDANGSAKTSRRPRLSTRPLVGLETR